MFLADVSWQRLGVSGAPWLIRYLPVQHVSELPLE